LDADGEYEEDEPIAEYSVWVSDVWKKYGAAHDMKEKEEDYTPRDKEGNFKPVTHAGYRVEWSEKVGETFFFLGKGRDDKYVTWQLRMNKGRKGSYCDRYFDNKRDACADYKKRVANAERALGRETRGDAR
jgi:hypothetical protein